jgi:hypothetical protein
MSPDADMSVGTHGGAEGPDRAVARCQEFC